MPHRHAPPPQLLATVALQLVQVLPAIPHALVVGAVTQVVPVQQPPGQEVASQTQTLLTQC